MLHDILSKGTVIATSSKSLEVNGPLNVLADLAIKSKSEEPESTYFNIEGKRVQEFILPNFFSNTVNDINNATDINNLYRRLPHLQMPWHQNSYYISDYKPLPNFEIEYIQGTRDVRDVRRPNKPTDKLNEAARLLQEIN